MGSKSRSLGIHQIQDGRRVAEVDSSGQNRFCDADLPGEIWGGHVHGRLQGGRRPRENSKY